jgi:exopolysaccharide biosynthesis polyprenyl glycosylphosphotransferase
MLFGSSRTIDSLGRGWLSTPAFTNGSARPHPSSTKPARRAHVVRMPSPSTANVQADEPELPAAQVSQSPTTLSVLIVGTDPVAYDVRDYLASLPKSNYVFRGFVANPSRQTLDTGGRHEIVGDGQSVIALARSMFIDELIFSSEPQSAMLPSLLQEARAHEINLRYIPTISQALRNPHTLEYIGDLPTVPLFKREDRSRQLFAKRCMDVVGAIFAIAIFTPIFIAVALAIKLQSSGPVIYASERVGRKGKPFTCYKFRTMIPNAEAMRHKLQHLNERSGVLFKMKNDPRVTTVGRVLRKYSLDELPQLWNVLRGDMSLVGPRPCIQSELAQYKTSHYRRLDVVPGLTGLWQVEARHDPSFESYIQLDSKYVCEWSLWLDLRIILRTLRVVLIGTGV